MIYCLIEENTKCYTLTKDSEYSINRCSVCILSFRLSTKVQLVLTKQVSLDKGHRGAWSRFLSPGLAALKNTLRLCKWEWPAASGVWLTFGSKPKLRGCLCRTRAVHRQANLWVGVGAHPGSRGGGRITELTVSSQEVRASCP